MGQLKQILEGYYYLLCTEDAEVESMAKERQEKCDGCVHAITIKGKWFLHCRLCNCFLPAVHRSKDKHCSRGKF
jgi:hypothetical protein